MLELDGAALLELEKVLLLELRFASGFSSCPNPPAVFTISAQACMTEAQEVMARAVAIIKAISVLFICLEYRKRRFNRLVEN